MCTSSMEDSEFSSTGSYQWHGLDGSSTQICLKNWPLCQPTWKKSTSSILWHRNFSSSKCIGFKAFFFAKPYMVECPTSKHPAPRKVCQWPHWKRLHFWSQVPGANLHETMFQRPGSYRNYGGFNIFNPFEKHWWSWTILPRGKQKIFENITQSYIQCLRLGELFFLGNVWDCWCLAMLILDWLCFTRGIPDSLLQKTAPLLGTPFVVRRAVVENPWRVFFIPKPGTLSHLLKPWPRLDHKLFTGIHHLSASWTCIGF